jgi:hypothetical protein
MSKTVIVIESRPLRIEEALVMVRQRILKIVRSKETSQITVISGSK